MDPISIISWLVFGLVIGAIARFLVPGRQPMGWVLTILLGIIGSMAGGFLTNLFMGSPSGEVNPAGFIMSVVGAVVVLAIYVAIARSDRSAAV